MKLHAFTSKGLDRFETYLIELKRDPSRTPSPELLSDPELTEPVVRGPDVEPREFASKYEAGRHLAELLGEVSESRLRTDLGLWGWLTLVFFDQVCPADRHGRRQRRDLPLYRPRGGDPKHGLDKHILFFPWKMVRLHGADARFMLSGPLHKDTKAQREWTGYNLNVCRGAVALAHRMYWDSDKGRPRPGSTSTATKKQPGRPGNMRRYLRVLQQLDLTYDIYGLEADEMARLLPQSEFRTWLNKASLVNTATS